MTVRVVKRFTFLAFVLMLMATSPGCKSSPEAKVAKYFKRSEARMAEKDYPRALLELRNAAGAAPQDAEPHYRMGLVYLESGDGRSAIQALKRAVALNPKHAAAQLKLAEFMALSQNSTTIEEAITQIVNAFGVSPDNPEALDTLAVATLRLGKPEEAAQRLEEALRKFPTHLLSAVTLARMKLSAKDLDGAEKVLKKAVSDAPQSAPAALALGELYLALRRPEQAEGEIKRALQLDPKHASALKSLGFLQIQSKRMDEAEQTFKQ